MRKLIEKSNAWLDWIDPQRLVYGEPMFITESGEVWPRPFPIVDVTT